MSNKGLLSLLKIVEGIPEFLSYIFPVIVIPWVPIVLCRWIFNPEYVSPEGISILKIKTLINIKY